MEVLLIRDIKGKEQLVFKRDKGNELDDMGSKVDDFEILQVLGEGSFGYIAKVKSRLNHKIYAMKKIDISKIKEEKVTKLMMNETKILSDLNNPLIVKYYKTFNEDGALFILMEFMDNGDIGGIFKASKTLEKPIPEEKIYDIFIQSMKALTYIHSLNLIHRDIKPDNLFITVDGNVKLGDFGVSAALKKEDENKNNNNFNNVSELNRNKEISVGNITSSNTVVGTPLYMSPEMLNYLKYDLKTDVYSMGVTFFILCYWDFPRKPAMDLNLELKIVDLPIQHNENFYSPELKNIILKMIEKDKSKRPTSEQALNMLIQEFNKKYAKVSSIGSVLCGLYSLKELSDYFTKNENQTFIQNNKQNKPISFSFLYGINCIKNIVNIDWNSSLYNIKSIFTEDNNIYSENKEMDPRHILSYLLRKMNKELAQQKNNIQRADTIDLEDINKDKALQKFLNLSFNNSPIFQFFYGLMKSKSLCCKCNTTTYSFNYYYFVSFNVELVLNTQQMNPSIEQLFNIQNNVLVKLHQAHHKNCNNCKCVQEFLQRKQFYTLPPFLIVCLDRGYNCEFKSKISYNLQLNLANEVEKKMITFYELTAIVKRADRNDKEHYICIYKDFNVNSWVLRDDSKTFKLNSPFDSNEGIEMIFFYRRLQNNSVIKQQSTF
jgi:serine/threonine protein kinase